jgi:hypothetical protein
VIDRNEEAWSDAIRDGVVFLDTVIEANHSGESAPT